MRRRIAPLRHQVVVVTGASSGIGRQTSVAFAREGCRVVVAARREPALVETVNACRAAGGEAMAIVTDVTRESEVRALASSSIETWGAIDIWINNAGTTLFSHLAEGEFELHRQVLETNLIGAMHCARAVIPIFQAQHAGILINLGSVLSKVGQAFVPSYVISKFGVRGLTEALRAEVADEPNIHICTIFPYAVDTPHFQTGGNVVGQKAHAMPPTQSPERVAEAIVGLAKRPRRELHVPHYITVGLALHLLFPRTTERLLLHALHAFHLGADQSPTSGNLFTKTKEPGAVHGRRKPLTSNWRFALWAIGDLMKMVTSSVRRLT